LYTAADREKIIEEVRRTPDREVDGTATWSVTTLVRSLHRKGMTGICRHTVWKVIRGAGFRRLKDRSWCETGSAVRKRKEGDQTVEVVVHDPDSEQKKT
jgi:hypothetical protein